MDIDQKRHLTFPLRLPFSLRDVACELAHQDGISLNHFISLAVAEKISRIEQASNLGRHAHEANVKTGIHPVPHAPASTHRAESQDWKAPEPKVSRTAR